MATKSMLKNVDIKEKNLGRNFVLALEKSTNEKKQRPNTGIVCKEISKEKIKEFFG